LPSSPSSLAATEAAAAASPAGAAVGGLFGGIALAAAVAFMLVRRQRRRAVLEQLQAAGSEADRSRADQLSSSASADLLELRRRSVRATTTANAAFAAGAASPGSVAEYEEVKDPGVRLDADGYVDPHADGAIAHGSNANYATA